MVRECRGMSVCVMQTNALFCDVFNWKKCSLLLCVDIGVCERRCVLSVSEVLSLIAAHSTQSEHIHCTSTVLCVCDAHMCSTVRCPLCTQPLQPRVCARECLHSSERATQMECVSALDEHESGAQRKQRGKI